MVGSAGIPRSIQQRGVGSVTMLYNDTSLGSLSFQVDWMTLAGDHNVPSVPSDVHEMK